MDRMRREKKKRGEEKARWKLSFKIKRYKEAARLDSYLGCLNKA